jgi:hypothetical protein
MKLVMNPKIRSSMTRSSTMPGRIMPAIMVPLLGIAIVAGAGLGSIERAAAANFDGSWTVTILTERGACDRSGSVRVDIRNGNLIYTGGGGVDVRGHVSNSGQVQVRVATDGQNGSGTGKLSAASGGGSWHGTGTKGICSGHWSAQKG